MSHLVRTCEVGETLELQGLGLFRLDGDRYVPAGSMRVVVKRVGGRKVKLAVEAHPKIVCIHLDAGGRPKSERRFK